MTGCLPIAGKAMSVTGLLLPARAIASGERKKSGRKNSRRTLVVSNAPSWPMRTDQTELR